MEKLQRPRFFSVNNWVNLIGFVSATTGIIQFFIPDDVWQLQLKLVTGFSIFFVCGIIYFILYLLSVNKFYKNYLELYKEYNDLQTRHIALSEQFNDKIKTIEQKNDLITEYKYVLSKTRDHISDGILPVNDYEKAYLENLYKIIYKDIEHLNYKEGGK